MKKIKIICVVGATASGKTELGVSIAKAVGGEIISADSMQVYKGMRIATAAAGEDERGGVPHYLLEFLDPGESFSAADFARLARERAFEISSRGKVPVIVGGTGLFIDCLVNGTVFSSVGIDEKLREELNKKSADELYEMLLSADREAAENIHKNNKKRVIRALELCHGGVTKTQQNLNSHPEESPFDPLYIGIGFKDRQKLYDRINSRVDLMIENGLEDEARAMRKKAGLTSRQAIGHKELEPYFDGKITLEEAAAEIKKQTRHYAKRQLTWFRRNENIKWLYADEMSREELFEKAALLCSEFLRADGET